jgi:hypothetical protein
MRLGPNGSIGGADDALLLLLLERDWTRPAPGLALLSG